MFVCFALRWAIFESCPFLTKVHQITPNYLDMFQVKNIFLSYGPIFGKVHQMTPNELDMFKVKNINMHVRCTPGDQIFVRFALRWAVFELRANFQKCTPNDPKWPWHFQGKKIPTCMLQYTPEVQIVVCFALRWAVFELWHNFWKSALNDPKSPWHVQGQKHQHACYMHP